MTNKNHKGAKMNIIEKIRAEKYGFVDMINDLPEIIKVNRFQMLLVRCGNGRFLCPAQDASHFVEIINDSFKDHVRDVSLYFGTH
jgi:hypothetical protein